MSLPLNLASYAKKLLALVQVLDSWRTSLAGLDRGRRRKVARYAGQIAATLARAAQSAQRLEADPSDAKAAREVLREFGRIAGYLETIVATLKHHLDGRKLAGVKRRLDELGPHPVSVSSAARRASTRIDQLIAAEGYFRALADSLRV